MTKEILFRLFLTGFCYIVLYVDPKNKLIPRKEKTVLLTTISMIALFLMNIFYELYLLHIGQGASYVAYNDIPAKIVEELVWIAFYSIFGILFYRITLKRKYYKADWEDFAFYGWVGIIFSLIFILVTFLLNVWMKSVGESGDFIFYNLMAIFALFCLVSLLLLLKSKKELRRIAETKKKTNRRGKRKRRSRNREDAEKT